MRRLFVMAVIMLVAGCEPKQPDPKEEFAIASCAYTKTGRASERKWDECRLVGKNSCGQKIPHVVPTEEFTIICQRATWVDKK